MCCDILGLQLYMFVIQLSKTQRLKLTSQSLNVMLEENKCLLLSSCKLFLSCEQITFEAQVSPFGDEQLLPLCLLAPLAKVRGPLLPITQLMILTTIATTMKVGMTKKTHYHPKSITKPYQAVVVCELDHLLPHLQFPLRQKPPKKSHQNHPSEVEHLYPKLTRRILLLVLMYNLYSRYFNFKKI